MSAQIKAVKNPGDIANERVVIHVDEDIDIGPYVVLACCASDDAGIAAGSIEHTYWFDDGKIKAGDLVVLYTKKGKKSEKKKGEKNKVHFFYWGIDKPLWKGRKLSPVLAHLDDWTIFDLSELDSESREDEEPK